MPHIKRIGFLLTTIIVVSAISSTSASAENPEILPVPTAGAPLNYTGTGGKGKIETTAERSLECGKGKGSGSFTSLNAGTASGDLEECKEPKTGAKCNTTGDVAGTVLTTAEQVNLVDYKSGSELLLGIVGTLKEPIKVTCGVLKIEVKGSGIASVGGVKSLVKTKTATGTARQTKGEQELKTCELPKAFCEGKTFKSEASFGSGFELVGGDAEGTTTFAKEAEVHF